MRLGWIVCVLAVGCGGELAPVDAGRVDASVARDGGGRCARASECDDGLYCTGVEDCVDARCVAGEPPCDAASEACDESAADCVPLDCADERADVDGDNRRSHACGGDDCDDMDGNRYPGNPEVCDVDGHDEDCDPGTYGFRDQDMDDEPDATCCNGTHCGSDCDDMRAGVSPRVPEVCGNGLDDDCDGVMDEDVTVAGFADVDGDGYGDDSMPMTACPGTAGFATMGGDCDEESPAINPGATETCDEVDNDCDSAPDDGLPTMRCYRDEDGDGYGWRDVFETRCGCGDGWSALPDDCADRIPEAHPGASWRPDLYCPPGALCVVGTGVGDWNCDGVEERRYHRVFRGLCSCEGSPLEGWWSSTGEPGCGESGTWARCRADCTGTTTSTRAQECR